MSRIAGQQSRIQAIDNAFGATECHRQAGLASSTEHICQLSGNVIIAADQFAAINGHRHLLADQPFQLDHGQRAFRGQHSLQNILLGPGEADADGTADSRDDQVGGDISQVSAYSTHSLSKPARSPVTCSRSNSSNQKRFPSGPRYARTKVSSSERAAASWPLA